MYHNNTHTPLEHLSKQHEHLSTQHTRRNMHSRRLMWLFFKRTHVPRHCHFNPRTSDDTERRTHVAQFAYALRMPINNHHTVRNSACAHAKIDVAPLCMRTRASRHSCWCAYAARCRAPMLHGASRVSLYHYAGGCHKRGVVHTVHVCTRCSCAHVHRPVASHQSSLDACS